MPFLTQGKTNWKFISIVVVFAIIAGAGTWIYLQMTEKEFEEPPLYIPEKKVEENDEGSEKIAEEKITNIFEVSLPINVLRATFFSREDSFDSSIGVLLEDYDGKQFAFCLDRRSHIGHYFFIGAEHPDEETAQKISYGSEEEKQLLKILESWDYSEWQPADPFDNTRAAILMFIRELNYEFDTYRKENMRWLEATTKYPNRVYRNEEFAFEFSLPMDWFVSKTHPDRYAEDAALDLFNSKSIMQMGLERFDGAYRFSDLSIAIDKLGKHGVASLDEFIEKINQPYRYFGIDEEINIGGRKAYRGGASEYGTGDTIFVENNGYLYRIRYYYDHDPVNKEVISTLRFLE